jgi:hypothetical protein
VAFPSRKRWARTIAALVLALAVAAYLITGLVVYAIQDSLVFRPSSYPEGKLERRAAKNGFEPWVNAHGEHLGWKSTDGDPRKVILGFHGQGGCALDLTYLRTYARESGQDSTVYLLEYPGYGKRAGTSSEESLTAAAVESLDLLSAPDRKILLVGQSLGTGVACAALRERPNAAEALVLLTPFRSFAETAASHYPYFPISPLLRTRFDSAANLPGFRGPVAFFICQKDSKIPAKQALAFYDSFTGTKRLWVEPTADHDPCGILKSEWLTLFEWLQNTSA